METSASRSRRQELASFVINQNYDNSIMIELIMMLYNVEKKFLSPFHRFITDNVLIQIKFFLEEKEKNKNRRRIEKKRFSSLINNYFILDKRITLIVVVFSNINRVDFN